MIIYDCSPDGKSSNGGSTLIDSIQAGGQTVSIVNKVANIPIASETLYGVVKSSEGINKIQVLETGEMSIQNIDLNIITQQNGTLILQCGNSQI